MRVSEQVIETGDDVFAVRQRGRFLAQVAGLDEADQIRLATALSELARDILTVPGGGRATFDIDEGRGELIATLTGNSPADLARGDGVAAARRLLPSVLAADGNGVPTVVITRHLPAVDGRLDVEAIRRRLRAQVVTSPLDELRAQNRELADALDQLTARQAELVQLNLELEETNKGVISMYAELSDELDTTNQGVVALYAELDETTQQLRAATEAKTRFLNNISHELRSPISSILGLANLLLDPEGGSEAGDNRPVELIAASAEELLDLVNALLDLAKAEAGRLEPVLTDVDLGPLVADVVEALRPLAAVGVAVAVEQPESAVVVCTDVTLIRQVVRNLVSNALAFTTAGSISISISISEPNAGSDSDVDFCSGEAGVGEAVVEVADTGVGISAENLPRVFEEFYQVRGPLQNKRRGTGLGLPYARTVIELLGGKLAAHSVPGTGSTFGVRLPLAPPAPSTAAPADSASRHDPAASLQLGRVLIVDDDPAMRAMLDHMIGPLAAGVGHASGGEQALAMMGTSGFDVVILDLTMPGTGGREVLLAMADHPQLRRVPVVVVTAAHVDLAELQGLGPAVALVVKHQLDIGTLHDALLLTGRPQTRAQGQGQGEG